MAHKRIGDVVMVMDFQKLTINFYLESTIIIIQNFYF